MSDSRPTKEQIERLRKLLADWDMREAIESDCYGPPAKHSIRSARAKDASALRAVLACVERATLMG